MCGSNICMAVPLMSSFRLDSEHQIEVGRRRTPGSAPLAGVVLCHTAQLGGLALFESRDASDREPDEERLQHELIEVLLGEVCRGVAVLAGNRLEDVANISTTGIHGDRGKPAGIRQQDQCLQYCGLLPVVAAQIDLAHEAYMYIRRQRLQCTQQERRPRTLIVVPSLRGDEPRLA